MNTGLAAIVGLSAVAACAHADRSRVVDLTFADRDQWRTEADEPWWALVDIRNMLNLFHPFTVPATGNVAGASREVTIPEGWQPPFALRFYCADDYFADPENHRPGDAGTESFFEHRYKQVLVDGEVVWERDVVDENTIGSETLFTVDLTPHMTPGKPFTLGFRVVDKVATTERNERDVWFRPGTWYAPGDEDAEEQEPRFHTAVWFADAIVGETKDVASALEGGRPHDSAVVELHRGREIRPKHGPVALPVSLRLVAPAVIPEPGFPVSCGVPMPPGELPDASSLRLRYGAREDIPIQAQAIGWWPDGSVRWVHIQAVVPAGSAGGSRFRLYVGDRDAPGPATPVRALRRDGRITIDTGAARVLLGGDPRQLIDSVDVGGEAVLTSVTPRMSVAIDGVRQAVEFGAEATEIAERGPVVARVVVRGALEAGDERVGSFVFTVRAYAGLPTLQVSLRTTNGLKPEPYEGTVDDAPLDVTELALVGRIPGSASEVRFGTVDGEPVTVAGPAASLVQDADDHFTVGEDEGRRAQGWMATDAVWASVWGFWQQFPKSLSVSDDELTIGLFTPTEDTPVYQPRFGESKRHDVWLHFGAGSDAEALGELVAHRPRLFDREWFCLSGGVAVLDPRWFENHPELAAYAEKGWGDASQDRFPGHFGIRNFGDMPYIPPQWRNGYWAMVQGPLHWGLASGSQAWIERSFETARHLVDVDSVRIPEGHADWDEWNGLTCALGSDHSVHNGLAKWPAFQVGESLVLHYWMTGDPDSLDAARANADYIIRAGAGVGSTEARSQARPMLTLLRVWQATGDAKYRDAASRYLDLDYQTRTVIEWRRGAYIQPTYQNWRCVSAGLDSMYAQNIYEYYRLTGDVDAARLIVAIADSVYAESMLPQEEGLGSFIFYVRYSRNSWYYTQMGLLFHMAHDLTGDERFLRAGRAAFARYLLCRDGAGNPLYQTVDNFGWLDPEYGGWETLTADIPTEPFEITSQTPDPDPSMYAD